jgi:predicted nuclease with RNAse H fold
MRTVGIDVAAQHNKTATCWIEWSDGGATIDDETPIVVDDDEIRRCVRSADKAGIDIPLGWPAAFVEAVGRHHRHEPWQATRDALRLRATDRWVTERARRPGGPDKPGLYPLSVSTNLIGVAALRIAAALPPIDRSGSGRIVEVYPKAALYVWGLPFDGYKGAYQRTERENLISELRGQAPWLRGSEDVWQRCSRSDHYLDALIASLVARAKACGLCDNSFNPRSEEAQNEGWIALPIPGSLGRLATAL